MPICIEIRSNKDGRSSYRARVRLNGAPDQSETFSRRTDAVKWAERLRTEIRDGRHTKNIEAKRHSLAELIDRYVADVLPQKPRDERNRAAQLGWWKTEIGHLRLADVTPAVLAAKRDQLLASPVRQQRQHAPARKKSPATVRRYLAALSHAFSVAMREWGWLEDNPFLKITKPPESRGRTRYLDRGELARLIQACQASKNPHLYAMTVLAVSTGMRLGEIAWLRRKDIDCGRAQIVLDRTKNNDPRVVPLAGRAFALLKARLELLSEPQSLVFAGRNPEKPIEIAEAWNNAKKRAGIANFRFHDLRHSAAAFLVDGGATDVQIAAVLGHRTLQMVKRYAHVRQAIAAKVVAEMNERIFSEA